MITAFAFGIAMLSSSSYQPSLSNQDWLVDGSLFRAQVTKTDSGLVLSNGLASQVFRLSPNAATVGLENLITGDSLLRAVGPEAMVSVDGRSIAVGGLDGQPDRAFLRSEWLDKLKSIEGALSFSGYEIGAPVSRMPWTQKGGVAWPPAGKALTLKFAGSGLEVDVLYELYDGLPVIGKRITIKNIGDREMTINSFETERLSLVEAESSVDSTAEWKKPPVTVISDYSFAGMAMGAANRTVQWETEPEYGTQVNYDLKTPCRLVVKPPVGPEKSLAPGESFDSFWTYMLLQDSTDRERQGMGVRKLFRTMAPWVTDNPLMMHLTSTDPAVVKTAIDQAADVGFEMVIFSFGSGLNMEDVGPANLKKFRDFTTYAHSKGLRIGGYSLLASRSIDATNDVINPKTGKPGGAIFGNSPCLESEWGQQYFKHLRTFLTDTGFDLLEHDGSYPGDVCASTTHPGHKGLADSQWNQYQEIAEFYRWCREKNIFLNVPDYYMLAGSNKTGMGYRETNWSLPRADQHIHARQNLFDGTWDKTPSMGWMFVPLVEYQGGGAAATLEPLHDHLEDYALHLMNNLGYGAQACYRGPRLYDSPETRAVVVKWVSWFKKHREILESDVVHVRRADGQHLDAVLHVNPKLKTKAMAVIYNPLDRPVKGKVVLPLYLSGLRDSATGSINDGHSGRVTLDRESKIEFEGEVPAKGCVWVTFE